MPKDKPLLPTFEVHYWNAEGKIAETAIVKQVPIAKLGELRILIEQTLRAFLKFDGDISALLTDESTVSLLKDLALMCPLVGKPDCLDLNRLLESGDTTQITKIFFTEGITDEDITERVNADGLYVLPTYRVRPTPSSIARINLISFFQTIQKINKEERAKLLEEERTTQTPT